MKPRKKNHRQGDLSFRWLLPIAGGGNANSKNCILATKAAVQTQWCSQGLCLFSWLLRCNISIQIEADKLLCLFPLLRILEHAQKVVLQAKIGKRESRMKEKEKIPETTATTIKQNKTKLSLDKSSLECFNSFNAQSNTRENYIVNVITEGEAF